MATKSKMGKCRTIFNNMKGKARKDVIAKFVSSAECTPAGAATYYQKLNTEKPEAAAPSKAAKKATTTKKVATPPAVEGVKGPGAANAQAPGAAPAGEGAAAAQ